MSRTQKFFALASLFMVIACSQEPAAPTTPLVEQSAADPPAAPVEEFEGKFAPGGVEASYRAKFSEGRIQTLEETRGSDAKTGAYEFLGARLMRYRGAALGSSANIELAFDNQGKVLVARAGDKEVGAEEIAAIRDRAQSLRSHAVAHYSVQRHGKP